MRVVDQPFPANGSTGLFKIDAHDDVKAVFTGLLHALEFFGIFFGGLHIVDRASHHAINTTSLDGDDSFFQSLVGDAACCLCTVPTLSSVLDEPS